MNSKTKLAVFSFLVILILLITAAFLIFFSDNLKEHEPDTLDSTGLPKLREEIEPILTNYRITVEYTTEDGELKSITEARCDQAYGFIMTEGISYLEYGEGHIYTLNPKDRTGWVIPVNNEGNYKTFGASISSYIFSYDIYKNSNPEKVGTSKLLGRDVTEYLCKLDYSEVKFWIDYEYGITMKLIYTSDIGSSTWEVTEFKTKTVTPSDIIDLNEYTIQNAI